MFRLTNSVNIRMKIISFLLMLLGFHFSHIILFKFSSVNFDFLRVSVSTLPMIFSYTGGDCSKFYLSSAIVGYVFFIAFCIINFNKNLPFTTVIVPILLLFILSVYGFIFELKNIISALNSTYFYKELRMGWPLLILAILIYSKRPFPVGITK